MATGKKGLYAFQTRALQTLQQLEDKLPHNVRKQIKMEVLEDNKQVLKIFRSSQYDPSDPMLKVNLIEWTRTHQGSIDHIRTIIPIENYTYYKLSSRMKEFIKDGVNMETFKLCFKVCIPELSHNPEKGKLFENNLTQIFNFFDLNKDSYVDSKEFYIALKRLFEPDDVGESDPKPKHRNKESAPKPNITKLQKAVGSNPKLQEMWDYLSNSKKSLSITEFFNSMYPICRYLLPQETEMRTTRYIHSLLQSCYQDVNLPISNPISIHDFVLLSKSSHFPKIEKIVWEGLENEQAMAERPREESDEGNLDLDINIDPEGSMEAEEGNIDLDVDIEPDTNIEEEKSTQEIPKRKEGISFKHPLRKRESMLYEGEIEGLNRLDRGNSLMAPSTPQKRPDRGTKKEIQNNYGQRGESDDTDEDEIADRIRVIDREDITDLLQLKNISQKSGLARINTYQVSRYMKNNTKKFKHGIDKDQWVQLIFRFLTDKLGLHETKAAATKLERVFNILETTGSGRLAFNEVTKGVIVLCGGSLAEKLESCFLLFDYNNSNTIDNEELLSMLETIFTLYFWSNKSIEQEYSITPAELAQETAEKCFREFRIRPGGEIRIDQLKSWCGIHPHTTQKEKALARTYQKAAKVQQKKLDKQTKKEKLGELLEDITLLNKFTDLREEIHLANINATDAINYFKQYDENGYFSRTEFCELFKKLIINEAGTDIDTKILEKAVSKFFLIFDKNNSGTVDTMEIETGMSFLAGGLVGEKLRILFDLFDEDKSGTIKFPELCRYFLGIFSLVFHCMKTEITYSDMGLRNLAKETAKNCFANFQLNTKTDTLTFLQIKSWFDIHRSNY